MHISDLFCIFDFAYMIYKYLLCEMPDESCRSCGLSLMRYSICAVCRKVIKYVCAECGSITTEQIHIDCFYEIHVLKESL